MQLTPDQYKAKMQRRKVIQEARLADKIAEKVLIIVNPGDGTGKTTAALGMV
ncbi:MAG: cob(I)yrinic acid a,c-diamide adenosyltransferase, partial [Microcystis sp.]